MEKSRRSIAFITSSLVLGFTLLSASGCSGGENASARSTSENGANAQSNASTSVLAATTTDVASGPIRIEGSMPKSASLEGKYVFLYETEGKDNFVIDSATISNGKYSFDLENAAIGLYKFGTSPVATSLGELIIDPREKQLSITHASPNFVSRVTFGDSKENNALLNYRPQEKKYEQQKGAVRKTKMQRAEKLKKLRALDLEFKGIQNEMAAKYPGTFFANMVSRLQSPERFDKAKYWNDIDFKDESLIHSPVLADRIEDYMRTHASAENTKEDKHKGFYNAVDQIAAKVKESKNDRVLEFMLYTMSDGFYKSNLEEVSHYVIDNYFYGDACGDSEISELFKMKAAGIRNLKIGQKPPAFVLPDDKGGKVNSAKVIKENELTLLIFWASFCHKCEEEIPILASVHRAYAPKGFEVIGISVDLSEPAWKGGIKSKGAPGYNVCDLQGWAGKVAKEYRVTSTPVMFLVDSNGELVLKPKRVTELERYLQGKLR